MSFSLSNLFSSEKNALDTVSTSVVGIDIGGSSVKVVELEETEKAVTLKTYGELQLGPYDGRNLGETVTLQLAKQTEALVDVMRESGVSTKSGVFAMPMSSSFMTVIPLSLEEGENVDSKIRVAARKYIPVPLTDVSLDWNQLAPIGDAITNMREVMLVAVDNSMINNHNILLTNIGMTSQPSEIEAFSTIRALTRHDDSSLAIIDLGAKTSKLYIVRDGTLERSHRAPAGGSLVTSRLADMRSISFAEAETMKRDYNQSADNARDIQKTTVSVFESPVREFHRIITQYEARIGTPIQRIVLTGGASLFPHMKGYIQEIVTTEVSVGNPFDKIAYPAFMEDILKNISPSFSVSLGAALRQFDYQ